MKNDSGERITDNSRARRRKRLKIMALLILVISLIVLAISYYLTSGKSKLSPSTVSFSAFISNNNSRIQIKDTSLLKKIILDSLNNIGGLQTSLKDILVSENDALMKIVNFQEERLAEYRAFAIGKDSINFVLEVSDKIYTPINLLTGERSLTDAEELALQQYLASVPPDQSRNLTINDNPLNPNAPSFDIRKFGITSTVVNQGGDGTCWAFAAAAAYEISYQIRKNRAIKASEQQVIECSGIATIEGGLAYEVFKWMVGNNRNLDNDASYPYTGVIKTCIHPVPNTDFYAAKWDLVDRRALAIASIPDIKAAICKYGSVVSSVYVTKEWQGMRRAVAEAGYMDRTIYRKPNNELNTNHSVLIIGWDDTKHAWLVKNSWGDNWGSTCGVGNQRGYLWLDYQSCNIGKRAAWIIAR